VKRDDGCGGTGGTAPPSVEMIGIRQKNQGGYEGIGRTEEEGPRAGEGNEKEERFDTGLYS